MDPRLLAIKMDAAPYSETETVLDQGPVITEAILDNLEKDRKEILTNYFSSYGKEYILNQVVTGICIEMEHRCGLDEALEIVIDHMQELPDYYTRLLVMEQGD